MLVQYREANISDISAMARIRSINRGTEEYWSARISGYMNHEIHPQKGLIPRTIFIALEKETVIGFIAGHLTTRYECNGELEWIDVIAEYRRNKIASGLLRLLAAWFIEQKSLRICVDVDPANTTARKFYEKHGAEKLNEHWLVWKDISIVLEEPTSSLPPFQTRT
jgi:ribosomal protein S18 acetylase RimI-like enzyme